MAVWSEISTTDVVVAGRLDSEFYRKDFLDSLKLIRNSGSLKLKNINLKIVSGPFGSSLKSSEYINMGIPFIRISDLENFFIKKNDLVYISEYSNSKIKGSELNTGDLVLSKVGNSIGIVSILDEDFPRVNISENNIGIRFGKNIKDEMKSFLVVYLNSFYGQNEILRRRSGNAQPKLNVSDIYDLEIPNIELNEISHIHEKVTKIKVLTKLSQSLYTQAQKLLERELGLDKLVFDKPLSYEARLSEVVGNNRSDAEYFHAKFEPLLKLINSYGTGCLPLSKLVTEIMPNIDLRKESGDFDYIEIGDIAISDGTFSSNRIAVKDLPANAKIKLSGGELVISQVRPTRGAISIIADVLKYPTICSGAFFTCRVNNVVFREIIWLYIRSIKDLFEKYCGGTSYPTIDSHYIRKLPVPSFSNTLAAKISNLITDSKKSRIESHLLLEQAKRRVEELIEQAVQK